MRFVKTPHETVREQHEEFVNAMWALFLIQNANPNPDIDGMFDLGVISDARPNQWTRLTPYSIAQGVCHQADTQGKSGFSVQSRHRKR